MGVERVSIPRPKPAPRPSTSERPPTPKTPESTAKPQVEVKKPAHQLADSLEVKLRDDPHKGIEDAASGTKPATETSPSTHNATPLKTGEAPTTESTPASSNQEKLTQWDRANPAPDKTTDPDGFRQWSKNRIDEQKKIEVDSHINEGLKQWDADNPEPADKSSQEYTDWLKKRLSQEDELKSSQDDGAKSKEEKKKKELSEADVTEKMKRYKQLLQEIKIINSKIKVMEIKAVQTELDKNKIDELKGNKEVKESELKAIKAEIGDEIAKASPMKRVALIGALIAAAGAMMAVSASKA